MSLTGEVKNELARQDKPLSCCGGWELKAMLPARGFLTISQGNPSLTIAVGESAVARRTFQLLRQARAVSPLIMRQQNKRLGQKKFLVRVGTRQEVEELLVYLGLREEGAGFLQLPRLAIPPQRDCCRRAYLRGMFLAGGSLSVTASSGYHLEIYCGSSDNLNLGSGILESFGLQPRSRQKNGYPFLYLKSAETVADFLRVVGSGNTLVQLESLRVVKSMKSRVNRLVNCETANLEKTIASAQEQVNMIETLRSTVGLDTLSPALKQAALARLANREASLRELGENMEPPVSKSAMNHRFRQMSRILKRGTTGRSYGKK